MVCVRFEIITMKGYWKVVWLIASAFFTDVGRTILASQAEVCNQNGIQQCEASAAALSKDPALVFPDTTASLDRFCRTWNDFTTCIYKYTNRCLSPSDKSRFNQSFKEPVMAMSMLCQDKNYRKEYLTYAPCIKTIATEESNCGLQYRFLIDLFSGNTATIKQLCCARAKFKKCILQKTQGKCDGATSSQSSGTELNVTVFAIQVLDKSMAFISQQCSLSSVREDDCPGIEDPHNSIPAFIRPNSKGPLQGKESELQSSASNEKKRQTNTTDFKLGKRPSSTSTPSFQQGQNQKYPPSNGNSVQPNPPQSKSKQDSQQNAPKQGELSASKSGGEDGGDGGVGNIYPPTLIFLIGVVIVNLVVLNK